MISKTFRIARMIESPRRERCEPDSPHQLCADKHLACVTPHL